jgi:hypothetical protein
MILCKGMAGTVREEEDVRKMAILGFVLLLGAAVAGAADLHKVLEQNQPPVARQVDVATWLTQPPNQSNAIFSDASCDVCGGPWVLADNVVIITGGVLSYVTQAIIWGGYYPNNIPVAANFEIIIHSDAGGLPGATICQYSVTPTSDVLTGVVLLGVNEHQITLDFPYCDLADGTYFIEIYTDTGPGTDDWGWETGNVDPTNGIAGLAYAFSAPGSGWTYEPTLDMAITLNGIPMPVELQSFDIE